VLFTKRAAIAVICLLPAAIAIIVFRQHRSTPAETPHVGLPSTVAQTTGAQLLSDDFKIVSDVNALPASVLRIFQEKGSSRVLMANPGAKFNPSDVILDEAVPPKRLILAGVSTDKCFVHYEQGGIGLSYVLEVFGLGSAAPMKPIWFGYCDKRAFSLEALRSQVESGECSPRPQ
jgi:hypothetical protein